MMKAHKILLAYGSERNSSFISEDIEVHKQVLPLLAESLQVAREHDGQETCISLLHSEERAVSQPQPLTTAARTFLAQYISPAVLEVFPEWQGILIESPTLEEAVWVVRDHQNGQKLAQETGHSSIHLDEILAQEDHTTQKIQEVLLSQNHAGGGNEAKSMMQKNNGIGHDATIALTLRQQEAITALLTCASVQAAAKRVRIGRTTLYRWLKDETFLAAYQEARRQAMAWAPGQLQRLVGKAVHILEHILDDPEAPAPARVNAARTVLEFTMPRRELYPEDNSLETVNSRLTPKELSREQFIVKEEYHDEDAKDLVERLAGNAAAH
jgi:hypothetical protein